MTAATIELRVPGDKSISHRTLLLGSLASGTNRIRGILVSEDTQATAAALRALGCPIPELLPAGGELSFEGRGLDGFSSPNAPIDCRNSGTTARLLLGLLAGLPLTATLTGDESLRARPMRRVTEPLGRMGARFEELQTPDRLPIRVTGGTLRPIDYASPTASAQVKSALLLSGLVAGVPVRVSEPVLSRDHTERMLRAVGVGLRSEALADGRAAAALESPPRTLHPLDLTVPGDFSSAAFLLALGLLLPGGGLRVRGVGVNPTRTGLLDVIRRMGGDVRVDRGPEQGGEPVADLEVLSARLRATSVTPAEVPAMIDEVPALAVLAASADGETRIDGAGELRVKESDRLRALAGNLRALGVDARDEADSLVIRGTDRSLRGRVRCFADHRIAMAFGVLGALPGNRIELDEPDVVAVSYPGFWADLERASAP